MLNFSSCSYTAGLILCIWDIRSDNKPVVCVPVWVVDIKLTVQLHKCSYKDTSLSALVAQGEETLKSAAENHCDQSHCIIPSPTSLSYF